MRYLVLTGQPRWKLVALRVPALMAALTLMAAPASGLAAAAMLADGQAAEAIARVLVGTLLGAWALGVVAMSIGTMLRSNGAGIGVALVVFLAGGLITDIVRNKVSEAVGDVLFPNVASVVIALGHETRGMEAFTIGLAAAGVILIAWIAAFVGASVLRAHTDEY